MYVFFFSIDSYVSQDSLESTASFDLAKPPFTPQPSNCSFDSFSFISTEQLVAASGKRRLKKKTTPLKYIRNWIMTTNLLSLTCSRSILSSGISTAILYQRTLLARSMSLKRRKRIRRSTFGGFTTTAVSDSNKINPQMNETNSDENHTGLTLLLPHIIKTRTNWSSCKLRVFCTALNREKAVEEHTR